MPINTCDREILGAATVEGCGKSSAVVRVMPHGLDDADIWTAEIAEQF
jgi:hypothetical protein